MLVYLEDDGVEGDVERLDVAPLAGDDEHRLVRVRADQRGDEGARRLAVQPHGHAVDEEEGPGVWLSIRAHQTKDNSKCQNIIFSTGLGGYSRT